MGSADVIVLGAGAAGLMCAATAGRRGRRVVVVDHAAEPGAKILVSGGGRCNFTNLNAGPEAYISANPHFCKSALGRYTPGDFLALVDKHRIPWHEKTLGQLFCDRSARDILDMLLAECAAGGVDLRLERRVSGIDRAERFRLTTERETLAAPALVLATGGPAVPKMGASRFSHDVAARFGLGVTDLRPGLVPLTLAGPDRDLARDLSGVSVEAGVACGKRCFRESLLFTHRGLSGPAALQISNYWRDGAALVVDLLPGEGAAAFLLDRKTARPRAEVRTVLGELLPNRLAARLAPMGPIGEQPDKALRRLAEGLNRWRVTPAGTEGFAKAEVSLGGVDTAGLSSKTLEARQVPGLFVVGEAVDVTGWLGGYNFHWAWASGHAAGEAV